MRQQAARGSGTRPSIRRRPGHDGAPLGLAQQRLWLTHQLHPDSDFYNVPRGLRLKGRLDLTALERSLNEIVRRHEVLRTSFPSRAGEPVQRIAPSLQIGITFRDLSATDPTQRLEEAQRLAIAEYRRPFDLETGPLLRAYLWRLDEADHVFLLVMHHIVSDEGTGSILFGELDALYRSFVAGVKPSLPELPVQYGDFAMWQREFLTDQNYQDHLQYWIRQLEGAPPRLELPADRPRPAMESFSGSEASRLLSRSLLEKLKDLSGREGVTLFMTLLAAFSVVLARYSGQEDIVVGSPITGRNSPEIEPLIGFFLNTIALRTDLSGDPSFRELLSRVKAVTLDAYAYQDLPFEKLVEELQPERSLSYNPIFQVMLALKTDSETHLGDLIVSRFNVPQQTAKFDLTLFVSQQPDGLKATFEYNTDLFDAATIGRALEHLENLLEGMVADPDRKLSDISLLGAEERHRILVEFNATAAEYPDVCVHDLVAQRTEQQPNAVALVFGSERITYRELNARANQIAHFLINRGAGPDVLVGIYAERTPDLVTGILGILKSGSAYVPLDPGYPKERLGYILEDAKAPIVLTQQSLAGELAAFSGEIICMDTNRAEISRGPTTNPNTKVQRGNLAYVLFTSGSTGRPKGVALEHRTPVTFIHWAQEIFSPQELSGVLFATSVCFDVSMCEMFVTLSAGGKLILANNALELGTLPARDEITLINVVPSVMAELVRAGSVPASVVTVNLAGEALPDALVEQIYATTSARKVYNLYGPTETSYSTFTLVPRGCSVTIGKPLANTQCYVLDKRLNPVPIGVPGDLYIAGDGEARGYYGRPELTHERFVPNPFSPASGARMYRTGDVCRWLPDGNIQYQGRSDFQVKVRGYRIELGEIEATLDKHSGLRQSIVTVREDEPGQQRLVAYVVPRDGAEIDPSSLQAHVRQSLPEFMVPSAVVILQELPLTPNGKVDRLALPIPEFAPEDSETQAIPRTPTEEKLSAIWAEVLKLNRVGIHQTFFSLGGHSLLAVQVVSRIRDAFHIELPLVALFESPTVAALAGRVEAVRAMESDSASPPLSRIERNGPLPLSFSQRSYWLLSQLNPNSYLHNVRYAVRITGPLDIAVLTRSLNEVIRRHEILHTVFPIESGQPVQKILQELTIALTISDFVDVPEAQRMDEVLRLELEEYRRPFDVVAGPLIRSRLCRLSGEDHVLLLGMHHIVSDGWAGGVLFGELGALYQAFSTAKPSPLPDLPIQYADFAVWQTQWMQGPVLERELAFWRKQLRGAHPMVELPTDRPRPQVTSLRGSDCHVLLSKQLSDELKRLCLERSVTLFTAMLAALNILMYQWTGQDDLVIGTVSGNRTRTEVEKLIGCFLNFLPIRIRLTGDEDPLEFLDQVNRTVLDTFSHQDCPFGLVVDALNPERVLNRNPIYNVGLLWWMYSGVAFRTESLDAQFVRLRADVPVLDLRFIGRDTPGGIRIDCEYNCDLFDAGTVEQVLDGYRDVLEQFVQSLQS